MEATTVKAGVTKFSRGAMPNLAAITVPLARQPCKEALNHPVLHPQAPAQMPVQAQVLHHGTVGAPRHLEPLHLVQALQAQVRAQAQLPIPYSQTIASNSRLLVV